jgi:hypothetical protein
VDHNCGRLLEGVESLSLAVDLKFPVTNERLKLGSDRR